MSFYCHKCGKVKGNKHFAAVVPGVGRVCCGCLNKKVAIPENRMVGSDQLQTRKNPLKMLPSEKMAKRAQVRRHKMSRSLAGLLPARNCSRPGSSHLAPIGASV